LPEGTTSGNEDGRVSKLNDRGDFIFSLDFTDGTSGVFVAHIAAGACCQGSSCSITTPAGCTGPNTAYAGDGTLCNAPGNNTTPCCKADYNHSGSVSVQDIFDFLAGYFSGNPNADINASGAVSVQDIFDFLAAYFAGC
jgi:hypothetical protein